MRDPRLRVLFVVLILAFPPAIDAVSGSMERLPDVQPAWASSHASFDPGASWRVHGIQCVLLVGFMIAGRERTRLEAMLAGAKG